MQLGHDDLDAGHFFSGMLVDRHPAAVINYLEGAVLMVNDIDPFGKSGDGLVDGVVDDFLGQMIRTRGIGIHAGTAPDRIQSL